MEKKPLNTDSMNKLEKMKARIEYYGNDKMKQMVTAIRNDIVKRQQESKDINQENNGQDNPSTEENKS